MADHSVFSTVERHQPGRMPTLVHVTYRRRQPRLWTKFVGECVSAAGSISFDNPSKLLN
jgi:hypothetical protein